MDTCAVRNDDWGELVRIRVEGAISDLHAADARYHVDCKASFLSSRNVTCAAEKGSKGDQIDSDCNML